MELEKDFVNDWKYNFPDEEPPNTSFLSAVRLIAQRINECEENIEKAQLLIKREDFILNWLKSLDLSVLSQGDQLYKEEITEPTNYVDTKLHTDTVSGLPEDCNSNEELALGICDTGPHNIPEAIDAQPELPTLPERRAFITKDGEIPQRGRPIPLRQFHSLSDKDRFAEVLSAVSTAGVVRRRYSADEKCGVQRQNRRLRSPMGLEDSVISDNGEFSLQRQENVVDFEDKTSMEKTAHPRHLSSTYEVDETDDQDCMCYSSSKEKGEILDQSSEDFHSSGGRNNSAVSDRPKPIFNELDEDSVKPTISLTSTGSGDSIADDYYEGVSEGGADEEDGEEDEVIYVNLQELRIGIHRHLRSRDGSDLSESGSDTGSQSDLCIDNLKEQNRDDESDDGSIDTKIEINASDESYTRALDVTKVNAKYSSSECWPDTQEMHLPAVPIIVKDKPEVFPDDKQESDDKGNKMRKFLVFNLLDSEKCYIDCLDMLCKFMKPLQKSTETSMPILSMADYNRIFCGIEEIYQIHKDFMLALEPRLESWHDKQTIGDLFSGLMDNLQVYRQFVSNYKGAMDTMLKCRNANETFDAIVKKEIKIPSLKDSIKLDGLLYKPVDRMTQYSLMLNDLLKYTPDDHPDRSFLIEVTGTLFDLFETVNIDRTRKGVTQRQLLKEGFVVELVDGVRKPRQLFLFSDILMCAKLKPLKEEYNCKWYLSLVDLSLKPIKKSCQQQPVPVTVEADVDKLRASMANTKAEIRKEQLILAGAWSSDGSPALKRRNASSFANSSTRGASNKNLEKLRKKLLEQENILSLVAPSLPWTIYHTNGKTHTMLMMSEEERHLWKEALTPRIRKMRARDEKTAHLSNYEIHQALETCMKVQRLGARFGSVLPSPYLPSQVEKEEGPEGLTGFLYVNIHGGKLFGRHSDLYCLLEVDSYGHFFRKGKTKCCKGPEPSWDEDFEIEVEAAKNLRLTCLTRLRLKGDDACGKVTLDLIQENVGDFRHHSMSLSLEKNGVISLSLSFSTTPEGIQRTKSLSEGVFGVPVRIVTRREQFDIPLIVITCVKEVVKRGLGEVGIYRLSGIASEIQFLKKSFNENPQSAVVAVAEADIHAVAGLLKLYFRELPEALFTDKLYHKFMDGLRLSDPEEKELYMIDLLEQLPRANKLTALYLMEHLRGVHLNANVNKMNLNNLATVFGPNVLRPSTENEKTGRNKPASGFDIGALDVMSQVSVFRFFLTLQSPRVKLPDDLDVWRRLDPKKAKQLEQHLFDTAEEYLI